MKQTTLNYLHQKSEKSYEVRKTELALQERIQTLAEKKFELESWERTKRIEMEEKKINLELDMFKTQHNLLEIILKKLG